MSIGRIIITGASGYIGSELLRALVKQKKYDVVAVVRNTKIHDFVGAEVFQVGDINAKTEWASAVDGVDVIVHTAARAHVLNDSSQDPLTDFRAVNVMGTLTLARQAMAAGVKRFIFISSIGVNGSRTTGKPFDEHSVAAPHADYALSKLEAEQELRELVQGSDMQLVIIRPPLVYAGGAPGNFQRLLKLVASGIPLPFALVDNRRGMIALDNLVSFIGLCVEHPAAGNELFLISDGTDVSTPEIISNLAKGMGRNAYLWPLPDGLMRWGAVLLDKQAMYSQLCGSLAIDSRKAQNLLGWRPVVSPADALQQAGREYVSLNNK